MRDVGALAFAEIVAGGAAFLIACGLVPFVVPGATDRCTNFRAQDLAAHTSLGTSIDPEGVGFGMAERFARREVVADRAGRTGLLLGVDPLPIGLAGGVATLRAARPLAAMRASRSRRKAV